MEKDAKIYVSGHRGMLGSAMMRRLESDGYANIVTRTHCELDLSRQADVENFFAEEKPDYVFHVAAKNNGIIRNNEHPEKCLCEGILISLNVLSAAFDFGAKGVVYVSSAKCYPKDTGEVMKEEFFLGGRLDKSWEEYAITKIVGTKFCESAGRQIGRRFICAMFPSLYGPRDFGANVMPMLADKFANAVLNKNPFVNIWGTGKVLREFVYSEDAADALLFLMEHGKSGEIYNVGSGEEISIRELAEFLKKVSGFSGELFFDATKPESSSRQFLDSEKIRSLGWRPKTPFREGVEKVFREHFERMEREGENV